MSILLEFEIEFKSDFHVGAGHGLGLEVDSALLRDPDHVMRITGTEIKGLLSEALMMLLSLESSKEERRCQRSGAVDGPAYCGQLAARDGDCLACRIFGSARQQGRWSISSVRPAGLVAPQDPKHSDWRAGETAAQTATRVRVNPRTRRAEENKLFTREEGDGRVPYRFSARCLGDDEQAWQEAEWLLAAARLVRRLGAGKRRGSGECAIHLVDRQQEDALLERFAVRLKGDKPQVPAHQARPVVDRLVLPPDPDQRAYRLRVLVRTDEPLLIGRRAEAGNQFETLESIPGSVLRGALAWHIARQNAKALSDASSDGYGNFVDLFFRDAVRFSPLFPVTVSKDSQGYPALPVPRDLLTCELEPGFENNRTDRGHGVWSMVWDDDVPEKCPRCARSDEAWGTQAADVDLEAVSGFLPLNRSGLSAKFRPEQAVEMHIRIEPQTGRVSPGDLFGYVVLEPGQYFAGEIICANKKVWQTLKQMAELRSVGEVNELRLGRASQRGYGKVSLVLQEASNPPWQGPPLGERVTDVDKVVLTLVSDAIVTDPWGRFVRGFESSWLKRGLALPEQAVVTVDNVRSFGITRAVDAFNAKLGLPRARDVALAAGSSVRLSFSGLELAELQARLARAEAQGIGLRRDEGFGRVAFNHPIYTRLETWDEPALDLSAIPLGQERGVYDFGREAEFAKEWTAKISQTLRSGDVAHAPFEAVARLLHVSQASSKDAVVAVLRKMGEPDQLLANKPDIFDKKSFYKGDGQKGMGQIYDLLDQLETLIGEQNVAPDTARRLWRTGLQQLADQIAGPARQKAQEGR